MPITWLLGVRKQCDAMILMQCKQLYVFYIRKWPWNLKTLHNLDSVHVFVKTYVTGQRSMSPPWWGRVLDPGKLFLRTSAKFGWNCYIFDFIFKIKVKKINKWKIGIPEHDNYLFIYVLEGNLQRHYWLCQMVDYLKGSIVKFKHDF